MAKVMKLRDGRPCARITCISFVGGHMHPSIHLVWQPAVSCKLLVAAIRVDGGRPFPKHSFSYWDVLTAAWVLVHNGSNFSGSFIASLSRHRPPPLRRSLDLSLSLRRRFHPTMITTKGTNAISASIFSTLYTRNESCKRATMAKTTFTSRKVFGEFWGLVKESKLRATPTEKYSTRRAKTISSIRRKNCPNKILILIDWW